MTANWIHKLNSDNSRKHKELVLEQALVAAKLGSNNAQTFLGLTVACYNPHVTWGIKQIPEADGDGTAENPWLDFHNMLTQLYERKLTGNAARDAIEAMMHRFTADEWNTFCRPVLIKDLRCGISEVTINKIMRGTEWQVPVFGCQLATNCEDRPEMRGKKRLEPKLDGVRALVTVIPNDEGVTVVSYSRNGKVFENFGHIEQELASVWRLLDRSAGINSLAFIDGFVLDGEIIGNSFQELMRQARRKVDVKATDSVFHVFDIIPLVDFRRGHWNANQKYRVQVLENMRHVINEMSTVQLVSHIDVDLDTGEGKDAFHRYCADKVAEGYEGVMIKALDAPYECKRNTFWLKYKPTITVDLKVIDVEEGTGRNKGRLGALVCAGSDDGKDISVNVGSGFSDSERDSLWVDRDLVIGRTCEIMCDVITQNQDGTYSLRFPRFVRFRDDK